MASRYAIVRQAGSGGSAVVFLARDVRHDRPVAIKVLHREYAEIVGPDRFLREIETAARLQHPHIVPIYDSGREADVLYCVMPFVDGETLRDRLTREHRLPAPIAMRYALEIGEALGYAHSLGVVHRDVKPDNVMIFRNHAMVVDFGIAKVLDTADASMLTQEGLAIGTPAYMSPEQAFGDGTVDGRTDQFSLACVLYEMLEGRLPFTGSSALAMLAAKARGVTQTLAVSADSVPAHVATALTRALSRDPDARFATVDAFSDALRMESAATPSMIMRRPVISTPVERSIAVLPFTNNSSSAEDEFLSDGISEDLMHALSKLPGLRVVARTSAFAFKGMSIDARTIGETLGVRALLSGSVRRHGVRIRITADLVDVDSGFSVWSERYDRERADVFDVQDEITRAIVDALRLRLLGEPSRLVEAPTVNVDAWEAYLHGRFHWNQRSAAGLRLSVEHLQRAVSIDPNFALAHAGLADAYITQTIYGLARPDHTMPLALAATTHALQLDPSSAEALTARGSIRALYGYARADAERDFLAALTLREQYATTHQWYAMHLLAPQSRFADARARLARARALDPLSPAIAASSGILRFFERDYEQAVAEYRAVLAQHPGFDFAEYLLGQVYTAMGRFDDAVLVLRHATHASQRSTEVVSALACAEALSGDVNSARELLRELQLRGESTFVSPALLAQIHIALQEPAMALDALEQALSMRAMEMPLLAVRPAFDALRGDVRFEHMVQEATGRSSNTADA